MKAVLNINILTHQYRIHLLSQGRRHPKSHRPCHLCLWLDSLWWRREVFPSGYHTQCILAALWRRSRCERLGASYPPLSGSVSWFQWCVSGWSLLMSMVVLIFPRQTSGIAVSQPVKSHANTSRNTLSGYHSQCIPGIMYSSSEVRYLW